MKTNALKIALVLIMMLLTGCVTGGTTQIKVSKDYLDQLIEEQPIIQECCPATQDVIRDWIMNNAVD